MFRFDQTRGTIKVALLATGQPTPAQKKRRFKKLRELDALMGKCRYTLEQLGKPSYGYVSKTNHPYANGSYG